MNEMQKKFLMAGIYLGDITLALCSLSEKMPSYAKGVNVDDFLPQGEELEKVRSLVEGILKDDPNPSKLPDSTVRHVLERAVANGRYLSARRCLDILGEKKEYIERRIQEALSRTESGDFSKASELFVLASNLSSDTVLPLFQYAGPELHANCTNNTDACITKLPLEKALDEGFRYLLGDSFAETLESLSIDSKKGLFVEVCRRRDRYLNEFMERFKEAHTKLVEIEQKEIPALRAEIQKIASRISSFVTASESASGKGWTAERMQRFANGLRKDFEDAVGLVDGAQFSRLRRRIERFASYEDEITRIEMDLKDQSREMDSLADLKELVREVRERRLVTSVESLEKELLNIQVMLLGRQVHSHEHWQYLRELSFKYPVSPLICCIRPINDKWMVVPVWESTLRELLLLSGGNPPGA